MRDVIDLFRQAAFDPEHVATLGNAYDLAIASLSRPLRPGLDSLHESIARQLILLAKGGERDTDRLCSSALKALASDITKAEHHAHHEFLRKVFISMNQIALNIDTSKQQITESITLLTSIDRQLQQTF
jgi:hypothetical protein